jgi:endonuclease/exonuclease/phosphatase family metal-dependent hydrolase
LGVVRVATFNAGLAVGYLPNVRERLPHVVEALSALEVDLLFVQELWLDEHWGQLTGALAKRLPHAFRPPHVVVASGGCTKEQLAPFIACANKHCAGLRDEALARCVVRHCATYGLTLAPSCINCMTQNITGSLEEMTSRCSGEATDGTQAPIAYGGSFGTGLLSRAPLENVDTLTYRSSINARGAMYAHTLGLHIFATHFSPGGLGDSEQMPQFDAFVEFAADRRGPAVLLGDLNTSSGSPLFAKLVRAGFREPDKLDTRPTCYSSRIDHVLVRDVDATVTTQRILDERITLPDGERTTLSDHYGVLATFG